MFPGDVPDLQSRGIPGWHGGERHRREGGGLFWGGPGFPAGAQAVPYANPCPDPRMIYDAYSDRCYYATDPFLGTSGQGGFGAGGFEMSGEVTYDGSMFNRSMPPDPGLLGRVLPQTDLAKAVAAGGVLGVALGLVSWPAALGGYALARRAESL